MDSAIIWRGLVLGFSVAAPIGPIGVLCIHRTLAGGRLYGFISGLGAAAADALYGIVACLGLDALTRVLLAGSGSLRFAGGAFLIWLGARMVRSRPGADGSAARPATKGLAGAFASTFLLTVTNPMTILSFAAMLAASRVGDVSGRSGAAFVAAVFLGSALWWLILSGVAGFARSSRFVERSRWLNVASGALIVAFGATTLLRALL